MLRLLFVSTLAILAVLPSAANGRSLVTLTATVTADARISLTNEDGSAVSQLDPGTYTINVSDQTDLHNFSLSGPGVSMETALEFVGSATWTVTFANGRYTFLCDAHPTTMRGTFNVGPVAAPPQRLTGTVTARTITLKNAAGAKVRSVREGSYRITVNDKSKKQNFHLTGPGINRKTKVAALKRTTWTLELTPGKFTYRSDKSRRLKGTFNVTAVPPT
jgi:plastocyanin